MMLRVSLWLAMAVGVCFGAGISAAAELKIFGPRIVQTILKEAGPKFERDTGHTLKLTIDIAETLARRIENGEQVDVFIGPAAQMNRLVRAGKISAETRVGIARTGIGVMVRTGAPKPDIGTLDAFKRTLLNAKSIAYLKTGASGVYLHGALAELGIADAIKSKVTRPETDTVSEMVAKGEIELGMVVIPQIKTTPGVALVGPLPEEIQSYVQWFGSLGTASKAEEAGWELLKFLTGPETDAVFEAQGMER
jgi:molybdate transport system substrate-binding protein